MWLDRSETRPYFSTISPSRSKARLTESTCRPVVSAISPDDNVPPSLTRACRDSHSIWRKATVCEVADYYGLLLLAYFGQVKRNNVVVGILHVVGLKIVVPRGRGAGTIAVLKCELGIIED